MNKGFKKCLAIILSLAIVVTSFNFYNGTTSADTTEETTTVAENETTTEETTEVETTTEIPDNGMWYDLNYGEYYNDVYEGKWHIATMKWGKELDMKYAKVDDPDQLKVKIVKGANSEAGVQYVQTSRIINDLVENGKTYDYSFKCYISKAATVMLKICNKRYYYDLQEGENIITGQTIIEEEIRDMEFELSNLKDGTVFEVREYNYTLAKDQWKSFPIDYGTGVSGYTGKWHVGTYTTSSADVRYVDSDNPFDLKLCILKGVGGTSNQTQTHLQTSELFTSGVKYNYYYKICVSKAGKITANFDDISSAYNTKIYDLHQGENIITGQFTPSGLDSGARVTINLDGLQDNTIYEVKDMKFTEVTEEEPWVDLPKSGLVNLSKYFFMDAMYGSTQYIKATDYGNFKFRTVENATDTYVDIQGSLSSILNVMGKNRVKYRMYMKIYASNPLTFTQECREQSDGSEKNETFFKGDVNLERGDQTIVSDPFMWKNWEVIYKMNFSIDTPADTIFNIKEFKLVEIFDVSVDGGEATGVDDGSTYTLPTTAKYGYYDADTNKMYKPGAEVTITKKTDFKSVNTLDLSVIKGAGLRYKGSAGIRFGATVSSDVSDIFTVGQDEGTSVVTEGMLISTYDLLTEKGNGSLNLGSDYTVVNVKNKGWYNVSEENYSYCGSVVNINALNQIRSYIARAYATINYADGSKTTVYSGLTDIRSVKGLAQSIISNNYDNGAIAQEDREIIDTYSDAK